MKKVESINPTQTGFRIAQFAKSCGFSRSTFYTLKGDQRPKSVKVGRAVVIVERPDEFLRRLAEIQAGEQRAA